jgi:hypothetical protein
MPDLFSSEPEPPLSLAAIKANEPPGQSPFADYLRPPRLGIIHFLAWITLSALFFGLFQSFYQFAAETLGKRYLTFVSSLQIGLIAPGLILLAAEIVGMTVVLRGRLRHELGRWQPGHFLIVIHSLFNLIHYMISLLGVLFILIRQSLDSSAQYDFFSFCISLTIIYWLKAGWFFWWWKRSRETFRWKFLFAIEAISTTLSSIPLIIPLLAFGQGYISAVTVYSRIGYILGFLIIGCPLFLGGTYFVTAILDYRKGQRRDWVHWLAIVSTILAMLLSVGSMLLRTIIR